MLLQKVVLQVQAIPRGFNEGDAGKGAYPDGAVAILQAVKKQVVYSAATFITPGVDAITITNGTRVEWLNLYIFCKQRIVCIKRKHRIKGRRANCNTCK